MIQMKQNTNMSLKRMKKNGLENLESPKAQTEYSNVMQDVYKNNYQYNPSRKCIVLIAFNDMISDKKLNQIVNDLFLRRRKLNISAVFQCQKMLD